MDVFRADAALPVPARLDSMRSQVAMLGLRRKPINLGAEKSPGALISHNVLTKWDFESQFTSKPVDLLR